MVEEMYINSKDECDGPISKHYFDVGSRLEGFRQVCFKCYDKDKIQLIE